MAQRHKDAGRLPSFVIVAVLASTGIGYAQELTAQQITPSNDAISERWGPRTSTTSNGKIVFVGSNDTVYLFDGTTVLPVQPTTGDAVNEAVMRLGAGATPGTAIGAWRRGAGVAYVSVNGGAAQLVDLNPEHVAIRDGCVFLVLQTPADGNQVFQIDPATGNRTQVSSDPAMANQGAFRVATSGCHAVWSWHPTNASTTDLQYWNGSTVTTIATDVADLTPSFAGGLIVYPKQVDGVEQVFLIDTHVSLSPIQVSTETDPTKFQGRPQTDGRHIAWYRYNADGAELMLNGGIVFPTGPLGKIDNVEFPFQLDRGQLLWTNAASGSPRTFFYDDGAQTYTLNPSVATDVVLPWLTDGFIAFLGPTPTGGADLDVFRATGTAPADASQPSPPLMVIATPGTTEVRWDSVVGATSYTAYIAYAPGVTKDNYASLPGGRRITGVSSGFSVTGVPANTTYYVAITALDGVTEGPSSRAGSTTFLGDLTWSPVGGLAGTAFYSVAADAGDGSLVYAGANGAVYKSSNGGIDWNEVLSSATTAGTRLSALAVAGPVVLASTMTQGDIWRSPNHGAAGTWTRVLDAAGVSLFGSLAINPVNPSIMYAGDFTVPDSSVESTIVKSINGGDTWAHTPQGPAAPDEINAAALAIDPATPTTLYAGSNGTPNVAKSVDGASSWTSAQISRGGSVNSLAIDPHTTSTLYAATRDKGVFKSLDGGNSWNPKNDGLAGVSDTFFGGAEFNSILVDPDNSDLLHLGAGNGHWFSVDGGEHWNAANDGFGGPPPYIHALAMTADRRLIAATNAGLYMMSLASAPTEPPSVPTGVTALAQSAASVLVSWNAAAGATSYAVLRRSAGGGFTQIDTTTTTTYTDATAAANTSYLYRVRASNAVGESADSTFDIATTIVFSNDPLSTGATVQAAHLSQMRTAVNAVRQLANLSPFVFTDAAAAGVPIRALHVTEMRTKLDEALAALALPSGAYTDGALTGIAIKAVHFQEIRNRMK